MQPSARVGAPRRVLVPHAIGGPPLAPFGVSTVVTTCSGPTMGTTWRAAFVAPAGRAVAADRDAIVALLASLVHDLSDWERDSALSRLNRAPVGAWQSIPTALGDVLGVAADVHAASDGAFDPTVARAVAAWGFGPPDVGVPARDTPARGSGFAVELDRTAHRARRLADVALDLGGIGKGYAVDRLSRLLVGRGLPHHLVEVGGELRGSGVKPDASPWWVALEDPPDLAADETTVVALHGLSIATSGDYVRYVERDGRRHAHTIDPRTAAPVTHATASVTVLHRDCVLADAHATAIMVLGGRAGLAYAARQGLTARVVDRGPEGPSFATTPAFDAMLG